MHCSVCLQQLFMVVHLRYWETLELYIYLTQRTPLTAAHNTVSEWKEHYLWPKHVKHQQCSQNLKHNCHVALKYLFYLFFYTSSRAKIHWQHEFIHTNTISHCALVTRVKVYMNLRYVYNLYIYAQRYIYRCCVWSIWLVNYYNFAVYSPPIMMNLETQLLLLPVYSQSLAQDVKG